MYKMKAKKIISTNRGKQQEICKEIIIISYSSDALKKQLFIFFLSFLIEGEGLEMNLSKDSNLKI